MVGHAAGETVEVNVVFPEDYQATDLAGEISLLQPFMKSKKRSSKLDDELAKDIDEDVETLDELKENTAKIS